VHGNVSIVIHKNPFGYKWVIYFILKIIYSHKKWKKINLFIFFIN
jgi:hypothetical protein